MFSITWGFPACHSPLQIVRGSKGYTPQATEGKHDGGDSSSSVARNRSTYLRFFVKRMVQLREEGCERWELGDVAGQRVEDANGGVFVPLEEKEAIDRVKNMVIPQQPELDADEDSRVKVEEADQLAMAGADAVTRGEHRPAARVEALVGDAEAAGAHGAGAPTGADCAESDVPKEIASQNSPRDDLNQVSLQGSPWWAGGGGRGS